MAKIKKNKYLGPIFTILSLTLIIMIVSSILSMLGIGGSKTAINNGVLESSLITIRNVFSIDGLKYIFGNFIVNFQMFEPLVILIIALIGIGIADSTGYLDVLAKPFKKLKPRTVTFITILLSIFATVIGEYSFALVLPLVAVFYKKIGRNPMTGLLTAFLGLAVGFGAGLVFNYDDYLLGLLTELSAKVDVDKNFKYALLSNIYILISSSVVLSYFGSFIVEKIMIPKIPKYKRTETLEEEKVNKKALVCSMALFGIILVAVIYMIIPGFHLSGLLLDLEQNSYIAQLFSETSPFRSSMVFIISGSLMACGYIYGVVSKKTQNFKICSSGINEAFSNIGYMFALMFFASQMLGILKWTNLDQVIATRIIDLVAAMQLSGLPLIIISFISIVMIGIFITSTLVKWDLISPLMVPLFMRANITPNFAQFVFRAADGIGKCLSPFFSYFIVLLGFLEKYNNVEGNKIGFFKTMKILLPSTLLMMGLWIVILLGWYIIGLPIGPGVFPTL